MPTKKKAKAMDAVALLKADHRKVEGLFKNFGKAKGNDQKQALATEICTELSVHVQIEEEILYPACQGEVEEDLRRESYVEHDGAKVLIAELAQHGPDDDFYDAKMTALCEQIHHHVKEEEKPGEGLFAQAKKAGVDMKALGEQLATRKEELLAEIKSKGLPAPETRSFIGHKMRRGAPVETLEAAE
ncbi:MAG: hemerythrin domain-containing protein [Rhizomicrobium sp.]